MSYLAMKISALYITSFSLFSFLQKLSTYMIPLKRLEMADSLSVRSARYASYISRPAMKMNLDFAVEVKNFRLPRRCSTVVFLFRDVPPIHQLAESSDSLGIPGYRESMPQDLTWSI